MNLRFKIGDRVTSVLNPNFLGQVIAITERENQYAYTVTYFKEDEPITTAMYGFELNLSPKNGSLGFKKE